jgi:multidrug efflux pump subunit AcrB
MRNALNNLADSVTDPREKKVKDAHDIARMRTDSNIGQIAIRDGNG